MKKALTYKWTRRLWRNPISSSPYGKGFFLKKPKITIEHAKAAIAYVVQGTSMPYDEKTHKLLTEYMQVVCKFKKPRTDTQC